MGNIVNYPFKCMRNQKDTNDKKIRVLLVDDQKKYLEKWGNILDTNIFEISEVNFPHEAIELFKTQEFDLVISDISMHLDNEKGIKQKFSGEVGGIILARKLRKLNFTGEIALMSTGIDDFWGFLFCKFFMRIFGVNWIVPKRTLMRDNPVFYRAFLL